MAICISIAPRGGTGTSPLLKPEKKTRGKRNGKEGRRHESPQRKRCRGAKKEKRVGASALSPFTAASASPSACPPRSRPPAPRAPSSTPPPPASSPRRRRRARAAPACARPRRRRAAQARRRRAGRPWWRRRAPRRGGGRRGPCGASCRGRRPMVLLLFLREGGGERARERA